MDEPIRSLAEALEERSLRVTPLSTDAILVSRRWNCGGSELHSDLWLRRLNDRWFIISPDDGGVFSVPAGADIEQLCVECTDAPREDLPISTLQKHGVVRLSAEEDDALFPIPESDALPRDGCGRTIVGVLALPSFLVFTICFFAVPHWAGPPPVPVSGLVMCFLMAELFGLASAFTLLMLVWAVFAPDWVERVITSAAHRLSLVCGIFLVAGGGVLLHYWVAARSIAGTLFFGVAVVMGVVILLRAPFAGRGSEEVERQDAD